MITLSLVTAQRPSRLSKAFLLKEGVLTKLPGGRLETGSAERLTLEGVHDLAELLARLTPAQALVYGICGHRTARILTAKALAQADRNGALPLVARTREHFYWAAGPGVLMLDHDPGAGQPFMTADAFHEAVYEICPALRATPHVLTASASSFIYNGSECLRGPGGWRLLVLVRDAGDVPRAGCALFERAWLAGHGRIAISAAGSPLVRGLLDNSVWQPERLDFCGGAHCEPPLDQRRPAPQVFNPGAEPLNTAETLPSLTLAEQVEFRRLVDRARMEAETQARAVREKWIEDRVQAGLEGLPAGKREQTAVQLRETFKQAVTDSILLADFEMRLATGETVDIGTILDHPDKYHGLRCCDPLEPDCPDGRVGWINLRAAGRAYIFSHLHGGRRFALHRARQTIRLVPGERVALVHKALELMRLYCRHYIRGGEIVTVGLDGTVIPREANGLLFDCDGLARWVKFDRRSNAWNPCDCAPPISTGILAARDDWRLPELAAVATAPTMDPRTGRMIDQDGFDRETGLLLVLPDMARWLGVPGQPNAGQVEQAVKTLWRPFEAFPFCGPVDRGVMLSSLLTLAVRPLLPTAPGFGFDAPTAASGKTLLAKSLSELAGDPAPAVLPAVEGNDETRKRLLAVLRQNKPVTVLDNVTGPLDSAALCAMLTAPIYEDRLLSVSETLALPTRTLFIVTGNNLQLRGDLCRRVLTARLDPQVAEPWKRRFDLDPADFCKEHRFDLIAAALTILRAGIQQGTRLSDRTASFELWSDTARQAVCWTGEMGFLDVADPVGSIDAAFDADPETSKLSALLRAWWDKFQDLPVKVSNLTKATQDDEDGALADVLDEIAGERGNINARRLGRWIEAKRGRIVSGLRIDDAGKRNGQRTWRVLPQSKPGG